MPREFGGITYYTTREACQEAGISKGTLFRWVKVGIIPDTNLKDRNGWRLFTKKEIANMRKLVGTL